MIILNTKRTGIVGYKIVTNFFKESLTGDGRFMQDEIISTLAIVFQAEENPDLWHQDPTSWPSKFFLWGYNKSQVFIKKLTDMDDFKTRADT